jgi:hypothetical protein
MVSHQGLAKLGAAAVFGAVQTPIRQQSGSQTATPGSRDPFIQAAVRDGAKLPKVLARLAKRDGMLGCLQGVSWTDFKSVLNDQNQLDRTKGMDT